MDSPFAEQRWTRDGVVAHVSQRAREECTAAHCPIAPQLDACVRDAVDALWGCRVQTFVSVLALRRVRACIHDGRCDVDDESAFAPPGS